jgi:pyridoxamine 5'-phosphate oxidase
LASREALMQEVERIADVYGDSPPRPDHWGGYHIAPDEIEFWADGAARLHDRFRWTSKADGGQWAIKRLNP